jgi:hypothetical protein
MQRWTAIYLKDAHRRLQDQFKGFDLTIEDVFEMQQLCPYEVLTVTPLQCNIWLTKIADCGFGIFQVL